MSGYGSGIANPGEALGAGLAAGQDLYKNVVGASREREQHAQDQQDRIDAQNYELHGVNPTQQSGIPAPAQAQQHAGFLQSIGQGLSHIGSGIANYFSAPGAPPAGALPPPAPTAAGIPGPPMAAVPNGGPTPTVGVPGGVAMAAEGGPIDNNTPQLAVSDPQQAAGAGGIPNTGAALGNGAAQGQALVANVINASREREQHGQDMDSRAAQSDAMTNGVMPPSQETHPIEQFAAHLHDGALNDSGVPNGKQAIPGTDPGQTLAATAKNPAAAQGIPEKTPAAGDTNVAGAGGQAHSLTPDWWDNSDKLMVKAAASAARAGHDGDAVFQSLNHMRTSFIQGHMLRNLSAANAALMSGDQKGVETSLRNMNYYLPDGKDLGVEKDAQGNLTYQNPLDPYLDDKGQPTTTKSDQKNMIPVDAAHLQMLGQNVLDPMKVNDITVAARSAAAKQALEAAQTHAQVVTADAKNTRANTDAILAKPRAIKLLSSAQLDQARAAAGGFAIRQLQVKYPKLDPTVLKGAKEASDAVDQAALGRQIRYPATDEKGRPSLSPAAGHLGNDPKTIPPELKNATVLQLGDTKALAADIYAGNAGTGMTQFRAAQIAIQKLQGEGKSHPGPDGKPAPNVYVHKELGEMGIWNPHTKKYDRIKVSPQSISTMADGTGKMDESDLAAHAAISGMNGGSESGESIAPSGNPDDDLPAKEN